MKRLVWLPIAGFLLIAGAAVATAAPSVASKAASLLSSVVTPSSSPTPADGSGQPGNGPEYAIGGGSSLLDSVLADLVTAGTITQAQSDAITAALTAKADARRAELEAQRAAMQQMWTQIQGFLSDGVITADEIAQLPADNPFTNLKDILADGQITLQELQSVGPFGGFFGPGGPEGPGGPGHHGGGFFFHGPDNDTDTTTPDATPAPNATAGPSS